MLRSHIYPLHTYMHTKINGHCLSIPFSTATPVSDSLVVNSVVSDCRSSNCELDLLSGNKSRQVVHIQEPLLPSNTISVKAGT